MMNHQVWTYLGWVLGKDLALIEIEIEIPYLMRMWGKSVSSTRWGVWLELRITLATPHHHVWRRCTERTGPQIIRGRKFTRNPTKSHQRNFRIIWRSVSAEPQPRRPTKDSRISK